MTYKSGFVAIIGRPNVGKSTLLNKIIGQKVVITSEKPQTTRKRIRGIYTSEKGQIIFVDTPGIHRPLHKLGEFLLEEARLAIPDADLVLYLVDGTETAGPGDRWIINNLLETDTPIMMVVNKVDQIKSMEKRDENIDSYKELFKDKQIPVIKISAKTGRNIDDLIKNIYRKLPKGPQYYPDEEITDQNMRAIVEEMIRERILVNTHEEIPHSVAVTIDKYEEKPNIVNIAATIYVEHDSQKGIIIGDKGSMIKKIGTEARGEIEKVLDSKVFLELFVKVKKDWRKKDLSLKEFGYSSRS
ncbi:MAG: GTPase Era [Candidatus Melainabacteria bacterium RIFOXYA12_FULL_32_12]|nr:MAG: GTPase Era [Candidatus Melainabacteria bacterium RIFOXYA2_FULL_32_9]OGI31719.1 MAG: GTPase Era [Candidatus Melainabacteria bacterium RIFOXYA12_FULL_32_12]